MVSAGRESSGICNLSFFEYPNLGEDLGAELQTTVERVGEFMKERKASWIGLSSVMGEMGLSMMVPRKILNFFYRRISYLESSCNLMTNAGPIDPDSVTFDHRPTYGFILVPPVYAPALGFAISGYDGRLTLTTGVPEEFIPAVDRFLDAFISEVNTGIADANAAMASCRSAEKARR